MNNEPVENTDKEIWREIEGEYYSPSIFVTERGSIGINVGGYVYVKTVEEWHRQADRIAELEKDLKKVQWALAQHVDILGEMGWHQVNKDGYTTPQTKPLSDEEIWEVIDNCFGVHAFNLDYQIALDEAREDAFELVKAILRKAQEK